MNDDQALRDFVAKYAKQYEPESDDYDRPPLAIDVRSAGRSSFYNLHYYHTKVPPEVIRGFILHYTDPGDLVLDPFAGSGMTGAACLMCGNIPNELFEFISGAQEGTRRCILNDLSPAACHIAYNYTTTIDSSTLQSTFDCIKESMRGELNWLYGTEHYEPAVGLYDPKQPEVAERLKNPPANNPPSSRMFNNGPAQTWQLLDRIEVEGRLGYPVTSLPLVKEWDNLDISTIDKWIGIPAIIQYTVWSDVYRCEGLITLEEPTGKISTRGRNLGKPIVRNRRVRRGCGEEINLWQSAVDPSTGEVAELVCCPHCSQEWKKVQLERTYSVPVQVTYRFEGLKALKSSIVIRQITRSRPTSKFDCDHIKAVANQPIPTSFQDEDIDLGREMMRHGLLKRGVRKISDFYTPRNLRGLAMLWKHIEAITDIRLRHALTFCFTSQVMRASRLRRMRPLGPGEQLSGTLYIAALTVESNVLHLMSGAVADYIETMPKWMSERSSSCHVRNGSATHLHAIPDSCIDFIFTDPPFGSNIFYADCAMLWENWLNSRTVEALEIVVNERREGGQPKAVSDYERLMGESFAEMFRVLKPNRYAVVEFNNSDGRVFEAIKSAIRTRVSKSAFAP